MAAAPADDLHLRMCKKIAQLTKVIYHLNIRNEDSDLRLSAATKRWEDRLDIAAGESAAQVKAALAGQDEERREKLKLQASLQDLAKMVEQERTAARKTLADREKAFTESTSAASTRMQQQLSAAQSEVDSCRVALEKRTAEFAALSSSLAEQARVADQRAAEMAAAHSAAQIQWESLLRSAQDDARRARADGASTSDQWGARLEQVRHSLHQHKPLAPSRESHRTHRAGPGRSAAGARGSSAGHAGVVEQSTGAHER